MKLEDIYQFVRKHNLAVLSTVDINGMPEAAVVEFAEYENMAIIIDTLTTSRKYKNLQSKKEVAIVIGWDDNKTVQINAICQELSGKSLEEAKSVYFAKNKRAEKWAIRPDIAYFLLKPTWIRYSDAGKTPWLIEEVEISA